MWLPSDTFVSLTAHLIGERTLAKCDPFHKRSLCNFTYEPPPCQMSLKFDAAPQTLAVDLRFNSPPFGFTSTDLCLQPTNLCFVGLPRQCCRQLYASNLTTWQLWFHDMIVLLPPPQYHTLLGQQKIKLLLVGAFTDSRFSFVKEWTSFGFQCTDYRIL